MARKAGSIGVFGTVLAVAALAAAAAQAADAPSRPESFEQRWPKVAAREQAYTIEGEFGVRYWYSSARTKKDLSDPTGAFLVSRLDYKGMTGHSGEGFGRVAHSSGMFVKGYLGGGGLFKGKLVDEDFPPVVAPYSSTDSDQRKGSMVYGSIDLGVNVWKQPGLRVGVFAGYHYFDQQVQAYGCSQTAGNPFICAGAVPTSTLVITQGNVWHSLRTGIDADIWLGDRVKLSLDAAYLPYVKLSGADTHHLRVGTAPGDFTGPIPEDGTGHGWQLQAALAYQYSRDVSIAVGGRYWRMETDGFTHFENHIVGGGGVPQPVNWMTESYGVFVQGSFKFGPYGTGSSF